MILQGVKLTIQPLGVGYANRPKKAKMGGLCGVFPYIRLPGFNLTTSAKVISASFDNQSKYVGQNSSNSRLHLSNVPVLG